MEIEIRGNLVAGEEMPSVGGGRLAVRSALAPYRELASWPTSGPRDVEESLAVLRDPPRLEPVRRLAYAAGAAALRRAAGLERLRLRLGLDPEEAFALEPRLSWGERFAVRRGSEPARGVAVVATHWSSLLGEPLAQAARELASGRSVLLLSDPRVPRLAALVAEALIEVAPVGDSVGVLHGLSDEGVRALVRDPRVVRLVASGEPERVRDLRRWTEGRGGAGRIDVRLGVVRAAACEVLPSEDPEVAAREVLADAFSRVGTLSGQAPGSIARVFCAASRFAHFTAALLAAMDESEDVARPLPLVDREAARRVREAWRRGLDQGATLIAGGPGSRDRDGVRLAPTVFTNVDPSHAVARRRRPMPILCLLRA